MSTNTTNNKTDSKEVLHTQLKTYLDINKTMIEALETHSHDLQKVINNLPYETDREIKVAHYIIEAVNNYEKLLDSNRELLQALKELHGYTVSKVKSYNIKDSTYFRTINMMANGLHNKFNAKEDTNS